MGWSLPRRRTKVVCTLGPRSASFLDVLALAEAGMDVARLNFSHGTHREHAERLDVVRAVSERVGRPIGVLQDLQGPKIRVSLGGRARVELAPGDPIVLTTGEAGATGAVSVSYPAFHGDVSEGDTVLLDDGTIHLRVGHVEGRDVHCKVVHGGVLEDHKGLNVRGSRLTVDALSDKDRADLDFGLDLGVDYVAVSFVQGPGDLAQVKSHMAARGVRAPVVAKIERPQAVEDFDAVSEQADAVMIARGDLGVEMCAEEVPPVQKDLIARCNARGLPVITATQMLDSMMHSPRPTRAEASDVANAVLDGSDAVMLSGETATGDFAAEAVQMMDRIVTLIEERSDQRWDLKRRRADAVYPKDLAVGYSACHAADLVDARAIVCLTRSGETARMIARFRPRQPIIGITSSPATYQRLSLLWGTTAMVLEDFADNLDDAVGDITAELREGGLVSAGDPLVFTAGVPFSRRAKTNMLRIEEA